MCPAGGTKYVSFELFLGILRGPGEGRGVAPGTEPLRNTSQNPQVTSRKACLRRADLHAEFSKGRSSLRRLPILDEQNHQSPAFSERNQLSQAILQFDVERMSNECTPIARFESQRNERSKYPKNLWRLFLRNSLTRLKIASEVKNNLKRLFLTLF